MTNRAAAGGKGYRSIDDNYCPREINTTVATREGLGFRWFQYDHLTLENRATLKALDRIPAVVPAFVDPNPLQPDQEERRRAS